MVSLFVSLFQNYEPTNAAITQGWYVKPYKKAMTLALGSTDQLMFKHERWVVIRKSKFKSTNKKIVTVSKKGVLKAKKLGKATVQATLTCTHGRKKITKKFKIKITVKKASDIVTHTLIPWPTGINATALPHVHDDDCDHDHESAYDEIGEWVIPSISPTATTSIAPTVSVEVTPNATGIASMVPSLNIVYVMVVQLL